MNRPPATVVVGGGAELHDAVGAGPNSSNAALLQWSRPTAGGDGWTVRVRNDGNSYTVSGTVYAICVQ